MQALRSGYAAPPLSSARLRVRRYPRSIPSPTRNGAHMKRVTGIGGVFFKAKDAPSLQAWYKRHLGTDVQAWGGAAFTWTGAEGTPIAGTTAWSIEARESEHFAPS